MLLYNEDVGVTPKTLRRSTDGTFKCGRRLGSDTALSR